MAVGAVWEKDADSVEWLPWLVRDLRGHSREPGDQEVQGRGLWLDPREGTRTASLQVALSLSLSEISRAFFYLQTQNSWLCWNHSIGFQDKDDFCLVICEGLY